MIVGKAFLNQVASSITVTTMSLDGTEISGQPKDRILHELLHKVLGCYSFGYYRVATYRGVSVRSYF